jgi:tetratricopeptide (TPR) repeat protein
MMSLIQRFTRMFSRGGRNEAALHRGVQLAQAKQPEAALKIYDGLINSPSTDAELRAQALFNRALAYSMLKKDPLAIKDLTEVLAMPRLSENVRDAARSQLSRVKKRGERDHA